MPHPLERRIADLQRQVWRLLAWYGLGWVVCSVLATLLALGLADYLLHFEDRGIRVMCSLAVLAMAGWSVWRFGATPFRHRLGAVQIAQRVERRFPQLGEQLSSSIEFLHRPRTDMAAGSAELRMAVIHEAETQV